MFLLGKEFKKPCIATDMCDYCEKGKNLKKSIIAEMSDDKSFLFDKKNQLLPDNQFNTIRILGGINQLIQDHASELNVALQDENLM